MIIDLGLIPTKFEYEAYHLARMGIRVWSPTPVRWRLEREEVIKYIIVDWHNNLIETEDFDSYEDGWEWLYENIKEDYEGDGTYDEYLVMPKKSYKPNYQNPWMLLEQ